MKSNEQQLSTILWEFAQNYIKEYQQKHGTLPIAEHDPDSISPCQTETLDDEKTYWQLSKIEEPLSFDNVAQALNINLHPSVNDYFCTLYADGIEAKTDDGELSLLFAWNKEDFERLQQNMIGHIMMKQQLKQDITIFFAVTDEEDMILSINNSNGEIWVEQIGCKPHKKLANSMAEFLNQLSFNLS